MLYEKENSDMIEDLKEKINEFNNFIVEYPEYFAYVESKRQDFIGTYKNIKGLSLKDYCIGTKGESPDSYCYQLEHSLNCLGSIKGSGSKKYNVFFGSNKKYNTKVYFKGNEKEALKTTLDEIESIINGDKTSTKNHLAINVQRKIAAIYHPDKHVFIYTESYINKVMENLDMTWSSKDFESKEKELLRFKKSDSTMKKWTNLEYANFLWYYVKLQKDINFIIKDFDRCKVGHKKRETTPRILKGYSKSKEIYYRDPQVRINAMIEANYKCELDNNHKTFIKSDGCKYIETHHIIPFSEQKNFKKSIDVEDNMICLCPNCHKEVHYGKNREQLLKRIYKQRKQYFDRENITSQELVSMYK